MPAAPSAAEAAPLPRLPETVRVNIAGLGTSYAVIGSTGTLTVRRPDGIVLYSGGARTLIRTDVRRLAEAPAMALPDPGRSAGQEARVARLAIVREARRVERETDRKALVTIPFEFSVLQSTADPLGLPAFSADRVTSLRYVADDGLLVYNDRVFRGTLELALDDQGDMIVVNTVRTGDYLASVVGAEIPSTWAGEALAAQAIAARTYLATHLGRHRAYDLEGDVRDQAYSGLGTATEPATRAVLRTAGVIATYRGAAIEALYSANAGGETENSENVFVTALPYLRSVPSPEDRVAETSSWGRTSWEWTKEITAPDLGSYLRVRDLDVGEPLRIELVSVSPTGRVLRARVIGTTATRDVGKDATRFSFGLRSSLFTVRVEPPGAEELVPYTQAERVRTLENLGAERLRTAYAIRRGPDREILEMKVAGHIYRLPARFVFSGRGFGHGVGMSQWGAQGMALQGKSAEEILKHYYRGIELTIIGGD
ncbi:MAG: SpoIID/LytB domain-containing protein [Candidatus Limnocylindria bacterium]